MKQMEISEPEIPLSASSVSSTITTTPEKLVGKVVEKQEKAATKNKGPSGSKKGKQNGLQRKTKKETR